MTGENQQDQNRLQQNNAPDESSGIRLLLVDDEAGYVRVLANRLGKRGFVVTKTYGGTQALQAMRTHEFDAAILDLKMEDMDGFEVLKILKRLDPNLVIIILSGHGSEKAARDGVALGAFGYLTKPCEFEELLSMIHQGLSARSKPPETADPF